MQDGPLRRAREALVRNFIVVLLKTIFLENTDYKVRKKFQVVLMNARKMHPETWERTVRENFGKMLERATSEPMVIAAAERLSDEIGLFWEFLTTVQQERLSNGVRNASSGFVGDLWILDEKIFGEAKNERYSKASLNEILDSTFFEFPPMLQVRLSQFLSRASNFADANKIFQCIASNAVDYDRTRFSNLIQVVAKNNQAFDANGFLPVIRKFGDFKHIGKSFVNQTLIENGLDQFTSP